MHPFLVRTRTPPADGMSGAIVIYVAMFDTKTAAMGAVREVVPPNWAVEEVIGTLDPLALSRRQLKPGDVERLA